MSVRVKHPIPCLWWTYKPTPADSVDRAAGVCLACCRIRVRDLVLTATKLYYYVSVISTILRRVRRAGGITRLIRNKNELWTGLDAGHSRRRCDCAALPACDDVKAPINASPILQLQTTHVDRNHVLRTSLSKNWTSRLCWRSHADFDTVYEMNIVDLQKTLNRLASNEAALMSRLTEAMHYSSSITTTQATRCTILCISRDPLKLLCSWL